ncbi:MAG: hypothetical protein ACUVTG_03795, partial [Candidatus Oleimicrobiaceae bacterium]
MLLCSLIDPDKEERLKPPVLVAFASKYGATNEIAERIGQVLRTAGLEAEVRAAGEVKDLGP